MRKLIAGLLLAVSLGFVSTGFSEPLVKKVIQLHDGTHVTGYFKAHDAKKLESHPKGTQAISIPFSPIKAIKE